MSLLGDNREIFAQLKAFLSKMWSLRFKLEANIAVAFLFKVFKFYQNLNGSYSQRHLSWYRQGGDEVYKPTENAELLVYEDFEFHTHVFQVSMQRDWMWIVLLTSFIGQDSHFVSLYIVSVFRTLRFNGFQTAKMAKYIYTVYHQVHSVYFSCFTRACLDSFFFMRRLRERGGG